MEKYKANSLRIIANKEKEIKFLHSQISKNQVLIDKSKYALDSLKRLKAKVDIVYINKVKEIQDFDAKQLENYFNEELN
jgi:tRNA uridine 5-carbamoylmethylation protein Kti12